MYSVTRVLVILAALSQIAEPQSTTKCSSVATRKEIRKLSSSEWSTARNTLTKMNEQGWFSWFSFMHVKFFHTIHEKPLFLPWHRRFIRDFEMVAQRYQPSFALPYWDSSIDFKDPASSPILTDKYIGGNGKGSDNCISDGLQSKWTMTYPRNHCLRRKFNLGDKIKSWFSPESITSDIQKSASFTDIATRIEYGMHAVVHNGLSGDMVSGNSPNDFAFFLHHSNVDRVWWKWQSIAEKNINSFNAKAGQPSVSLNDGIDGYSEKISEVMRVGYGKMCFTYDDNGKLSRRNDGMTSNTKDVDLVLQVPQMSLATGVKDTTLAKFFPLITADADTPASSVDLPDEVSKNAVDFATKQLNVTENPSKDVVPGSICETVVKQSNNMEFNNVVVNSNDKDNEIIVNSFDTQKFSEEKNTKNTLEVLTDAVAIIANKAGDVSVMPVPDRIADEFLTLNHYDPVSYQAYYNEKVGLVNALNSDGYVSPYI